MYGPNIKHVLTALERDIDVITSHKAYAVSLEQGDWLYIKECARRLLDCANLELNDEDGV